MASIDRSNDAGDLIDDLIDGEIVMRRLNDPSDPMISSEELRRRLADG